MVPTSSQITKSEICDVSSNMQGIRQEVSQGLAKRLDKESEKDVD